jgi:hypothetical protein
MLVVKSGSILRKIPGAEQDLAEKKGSSVELPNINWVPQIPAVSSIEPGGWHSMTFKFSSRMFTLSLKIYQ